MFSTKFLKDPSTRGNFPKFGNKTEIEIKINLHKTFQQRFMSNVQSSQSNQSYQINWNWA